MVNDKSAVSGGTAVWFVYPGCQRLFRAGAFLQFSSASQNLAVRKPSRVSKKSLKKVKWCL